MVSEASALYSPGYLDESIGSELVAFASVCIALNIFVVGLRFAARYVSRAPVGADDYLTIPALVFLVADGAVTIGKTILQAALVHIFTNRRTSQLWRSMAVQATISLLL